MVLIEGSHHRNTRVTPQEALLTVTEPYLKQKMWLQCVWAQDCKADTGGRSSSDSSGSGGKLSRDGGSRFLTTTKPEQLESGALKPQIRSFLTEHYEYLLSESKALDIHACGNLGGKHGMNSFWDIFAIPCMYCETLRTGRPVSFAPYSAPRL